MRIFCFPSFYPYNREGEKWRGIFAHKQYLALKECGAEVIVVNPKSGFPIWPFHLLFSDWRQNKADSYPKQRRYDGLTVYHPRVFSPKPGRIFRKPFSEQYIARVRSFLKPFRLDKKTDIFFAQWLPEAELVVKMGKRLGIKTAILGVGDDITQIPEKSAKHLEIFKQCWMDADLRAVVADYLGRYANKLIKESVEYKVYLSSVDNKLFFPVSLAEKKKLREKLKLPLTATIILTVGSAIERKGWLELFPALRNIVAIHPTVFLVGINSGFHEIDLDKEAMDNRLEKHWLNLFDVDPAEIHNYYKASDIFCLPSHWEGLANAVVEALACGLGVITTDVNGHSEVITNGENGLLVPPKKKLLLQQALETLVADKKARSAMGALAAKQALDKPGTHLANAHRIIHDFEVILTA